MRFITVILKEALIMNESMTKSERTAKRTHLFPVIVNKEISDHIKSWRFILLITIIALTCFGSLYSSLTNINKVAESQGFNSSFLPEFVYLVRWYTAFFHRFHRFSGALAWHH